MKSLEINQNPRLRSLSFFRQHHQQHHAVPQEDRGRSGRCRPQGQEGPCPSGSERSPGCEFLSSHCLASHASSDLRDGEIAKRRNLLDLVLTHEEHAHQQRRVRSKHNVSIQFLSPGLNQYNLALTGQVDLVDGRFRRITNI